MKTKAYTTILAVISLILFSAVGARAQTEHQHDAYENDERGDALAYGGDDEGHGHASLDA